MESKWESLLNWTPIVGRWTLENGNPTYIGPQEGVPDPYGICIANIRFGEGSIRLKVSRRLGSSGRVLLGYRAPNHRYLTVGLSGYGFAHVVANFDPAYGWRGLLMTGSEKDLNDDKEYELEVKLVGTRLYLSVDGNQIFEHIVDHPLASNQIGLFTWGDKNVKFRDVKVRKISPKVFVIMEFSQTNKDLFSKVIQPIAREFELEAYHVGEVPGPGVILRDIVQGIIEAPIIVAEVTSKNPNVFYEVGYAHAFGKPTILLAEQETKLPFDIAVHRCIFYENTIAGKGKMEEELRKHLQAILRD